MGKRGEEAERRLAGRGGEEGRGVGGVVVWVGRRGGRGRREAAPPRSWPRSYPKPLVRPSPDGAGSEGGGNWG